MPDSEHPDPTPPPEKPSFWAELRRRKVMRVAITYAIVAWLIIQIASVTFGGFGIPEWAFRFVVLMLVLGFPVALIITWAFELTPEGIKTTKAARQDRAGKSISDKHQSKRNWMSLVFAASLPTLIFGSLALFFYIRLGTEIANPPEPPSESVDLSHAIAVMPLVNMSSDSENEYFAGGVHEEILTNLSRIKDFKVTSRTTVLRYADSRDSLPIIAKDLKVKYIVEGSVRKIGNHVRVTIQLIDALNDHHLWANNFERELLDVFATQSEVAREISDSLHLEIQPDTVGKLIDMPTTSVLAYDLYIKSIDLQKTELRTEENVLRVRSMLEEATKLDSDFAEAWARLKRVYDYILYQIRDDGDFLPEGADRQILINEFSVKADNALAKAMALDPDNVETLLAHASEGNPNSTRSDNKERQRRLKAIVEKYPENAEALYWYSLTFRISFAAKSPSLETHMEKALELDPFNALIVRGLLLYYRTIGDQKNVTRLSDRLTEIIPETAEDRRLARISSWGKASRARLSFIQTADESLIEELEELWRSSDEAHEGKLRKDHGKRNISSFINDTERLLELAEENARIESYVRLEMWDYFDIQKSALSVYWNRGDKEGARRIAQRMKDTLVSPVLREWMATGAGFVRDLAIAYFVLGELKEAQSYLDQLLDEQSDLYAVDQAISVLQWTDIDRAVELALSFNAKYPDSLALDWKAAYFINELRFVTHPKMQEYYLKQGKWIDYLSKRVPEYAKYKTQ